MGRRESLGRDILDHFLNSNGSMIVAYELALPQHLLAVHPIFHISMLMRYIPDQSHIINYKEIELQPNLSYKKPALRILGL